MKLLLEGISGSGKTLQIGRLQRRLRSFASVARIGEFSRGLIGRAVRRSYRLQRERFVRFHSADPFADQTHLLLLADTIAKAEEMSRSTAEILLVDRLFDSWLCYTLAAGDRRGLQDAAVRTLHQRCSREHVASDAVTVFLELEVMTALERITNRDGFELKRTEQQRLEATARQFADLYADAPVLRVDAGRSPAEVTAAILDAVGLKV
ncbi:MAG TPA: hypothetical protein VFE33_26015 [Thermoanaerobaculia bacterium]|nr:hypothetical protein [Thermoanaerobaculia bacterium]